MSSFLEQQEQQKISKNISIGHKIHKITVYHCKPIHINKEIADNVKNAKLTNIQSRITKYFIILIIQLSKNLSFSVLKILKHMNDIKLPIIIEKNNTKNKS